jgi:hypothetical protein
VQRRYPFKCHAATFNIQSIYPLHIRLIARLFLRLRKMFYQPDETEGVELEGMPASSLYNTRATLTTGMGTNFLTYDEFGTTTTQNHVLNLPNHSSPSLSPTSPNTPANTLPADSVTQLNARFRSSINLIRPNSPPIVLSRLSRRRPSVRTVGTS